MARENSKLIFIFVSISYVTTQDYYEQRHTQHFKTQYMGHLKEIPRRFEVRGDNAQVDFQKYINDIHDLAHNDNLTVIYKVKVEIIKPLKQYLAKKQLLKSKPKKYNIPLKKKNMKLSNFEIIMRKLADVAGPQAYSVMTTEDQMRLKKIVTTKMPMLKYKPIVSRIRTNYTKIIKPVRNRIITLSK